MDFLGPFQNFFGPSFNAIALWANFQSIFPYWITRNAPIHIQHGLLFSNVIPNQFWGWNLGLKMVEFSPLERWSVGRKTLRDWKVLRSHSLRRSCQDGARLTFVVKKERGEERLKRDSSLIVAEQETEKRGGSFAFSRQRNQSPPRAAEVT